jgi:ubiquinone/menaquinone biosynthesis C-methylase UbiE
MSEVFDYFNRVAVRWDQMQNQYFGDDIRNALFDSISIGRDMTVADIGAGTGYLAFSLSRLCKRVVAIDASAAMLLEAAKKAKEREIGNIEFIQGNVYNLPVDSDSVDMFFSNMMLHHIEYPDRAIKEMCRILKKAGKLYLTDICRHSGEWVRNELMDCWLGFDRQDITNWYKRSGLLNISVRDLGCRCRAVSSKGETLEVQVFIAEGTK